MAFAANSGQSARVNTRMAAKERMSDAPLTAKNRTISPMRSAPARNVTPRFHAKLFTIPHE